VPQATTSQKLSPAVRRLVAEHKIDIAAVPGTGRSGRVTRRNVVEFIESGRAPSAPTARAPAASVAAPASGRAAAAPAAPARLAPAPSARSQAAPASDRVPFNRIRKLTADHMVKSKATSPHVLQAVEVDFSGVDRVRKAVRESWKAQHGYSLTYLPFIAHAVCKALKDFPHANASVHDDDLVLHADVNLAIAVDLGTDGLVAPVIRRADRLSLAQLAETIVDVAGRARSNKLKADDLSGGTYTLSNSGTFGTLITAPIINQPQVAILSIDGVRKKPVVIERPDGDSIAIRPVGILAQSFDHRAIDGAYSAAYLDRLRKLIELTDWFREI
jgi:2-oxoglutarate dehydrogenase E2 component (dihydrolipoamide succinyltransferase)